jgi:hypothetical protein
VEYKSSKEMQCRIKILLSGTFGFWKKTSFNQHQKMHNIILLESDIHQHFQFVDYEVKHLYRHNESLFKCSIQDSPVIQLSCCGEKSFIVSAVERTIDKVTVTLYITSPDVRANLEKLDMEIKQKTVQMFFDNEIHHTGVQSWVVGNQIKLNYEINDSFLFGASECEDTQSFLLEYITPDSIKVGCVVVPMIKWLSSTATNKTKLAQPNIHIHALIIMEQVCDPRIFIRQVPSFSDCEFLFSC